MISLTQILVPTDFSEPSDNAMRYARALAETFGAALHLLHVVEEPVMYGWEAYSPELIREGLLVAAGGIPMKQEHRFEFRGHGLCLELEIGDDEPPRSITAAGVFGDAEVLLLRSLCRQLSASFYDSEEGDFAF